MPLLIDTIGGRSIVGRSLFSYTMGWLVIDSSRAETARRAADDEFDHYHRHHERRSGKSTLASCLAVHCSSKGAAPHHRRPIRSARSRGLAEREKAIGGVPVVEDSSPDVWKTARRLARRWPGHHRHAGLPLAGDDLESGVTILCWFRSSLRHSTSDRMLDTLNLLLNAPRVGGRLPLPADPTTRDSIISKHIRAELAKPAFPSQERAGQPGHLCRGGALGRNSSMIDRTGPAARDIAAVAQEVDVFLDAARDVRQAASA